MPHPWEMRVETSGGVEDLSRVIGVLALLGLTPVSLTCQPFGGGLKIVLRLNCAERERSLCLARIGVLACVAKISGAAAAPLKLESKRCAATSL